MVKCKKLCFILIFLKRIRTMIMETAKHTKTNMTRVGEITSNDVRKSLFKVASTNIGVRVALYAYR